MTEPNPRSDGVGRPLVAAGAAFILCFGGIAGWTAQAPLASAVIAEGRIAVEGESKRVQHLEGGIIAELLVAEGETVAAGDPLVRLDVTDSAAERAGLIAERDAAATRSLRLRAELTDKAPDFSDLVSGDPDSLASAVASQEALFAARESERSAERDMLDAALQRLAAGSTAIEAELAGIDAQLTLTQEDAVATRELSERGVVSRAALRDSERALAGLIGSRASLAAQLAEARAAEAETRLRRAETDTRRVAAISQELAEVTGRLAEIAPALLAAEERIRRAELRAPVAGEVVGLSVATIGGVIAPGEPIMDIVPRSAVLIAEAELLPADRERLSLGMASEIRLPGLEGRGDARLEGVIAQISADRIEATTPEAEEGHYRMIVTLPDDRTGTSLAPGMPVTVVVPTKPRTMVDYLLSPLRDAIARSMREV